MKEKINKIGRGAMFVLMFVFANKLIEYTGSDWILDSAGDVIGALTYISMGIYYAIIKEEEENDKPIIFKHV